MWKYFCLGLLVGWLAEWLIDLGFWRRRQYSKFDVVQPAAPPVDAASAAVAGNPPVA
jgi:hypothetical protein